MIAQDGPISNPTRNTNLISPPVHERARVCGTGPESLPPGRLPGQRTEPDPGTGHTANRATRCNSCSLWVFLIMRGCATRVRGKAQVWGSWYSHFSSGSVRSLSTRSHFPSVKNASNERVAGTPGVASVNKERNDTPFAAQHVRESPGCEIEKKAPVRSDRSLLCLRRWRWVSPLWGPPDRAATERWRSLRGRHLH